jgi:hypothetical protein
MTACIIARGRIIAHLNVTLFQAIEGLKMFEKKDQQHRAMAATNLSFIYFLEQDYNQVSMERSYVFIYLLMIYAHRSARNRRINMPISPTRTIDTMPRRW